MGLRWLAGVALALVLAGGAAAAVDNAGTPRCRAAAIGADGFCEVDGARLHFVDWGGRGPPLILLAGFGDSARVFDDLAPRLTKARHVYSLTRRGFGRSAHTPGDYSAARLGDDVVAMMDALGIGRADIVGHSAAGAEMVLVAKRHPARVSRLVYLDAAYDRSGALAMEAQDPANRAPPAAALASFEAFTAWRQAVLGTRSAAVGANVRETFRVADGRLVRRTAPAQLLELSTAGLMEVAPDYAAIPAPSLAIYAPKDQPEQLSPGTPAAMQEASRQYGLRRVRPWMLREQARFLEEAPCGVAVELSAETHYFYLRQPRWTAETILSFLTAPAPCRWRLSTHRVP